MYQKKVFMIRFIPLYEAYGAYLSVQRLNLYVRALEREILRKQGSAKTPTLATTNTRML